MKREELIGSPEREPGTCPHAARGTRHAARTHTRTRVFVQSVGKCVYALPFDRPRSLQCLRAGGVDTHHTLTSAFCTDESITPQTRAKSRFAAPTLVLALGYRARGTGVLTGIRAAEGRGLGATG